MKHILLLVAVAMLASFADVAQAAAPSTSGTTAGRAAFRVEGPYLPNVTPPAQDTARYLPDTTLLARVADREIRAGDYRMRYWSLGADDRPRPDSLGRIGFLNSLIDKDVLGLSAREVNPPFEFTQRADLRRTTTTVLQNTLHQRMVLDSIVVTEEDIARHVPQFNRGLHLRRILFHDRATAERVRRELQRGQLSWSVAVKRYSQAADSLEDGDLGWFNRSKLEGETAIKLFSLQPGQLSEVLQDSQGFHLIQVTGEQPMSPPSIFVIRRMLIRDLRDMRAGPLVRRMYEQARARVGMAYDTANIRWAADRFREIESKQSAAPGMVIRLNTRVPDFAPADTGRTLARTSTRSYSLGGFMEEYVKIPAPYRRSMANFEPFIYAMNGIFLGPVLADIAAERGLDKDPLAVSQIEEHRERLMVERVYDDSVTRHVRVTDAMRHRYFDEHEKEFFTTPGVRYAMFIRASKAGADSVVERLASGVGAATIVAQDSARGRGDASRIHKMLRGEPNQYGKILFEELRPGGSTILGPDAGGKYLVLNLIEELETRQMSYEESLNIVDESVQNIEAERLFKAYLDRHRPKYRIETWPELLPPVRLTDPILD